MGFGKYQSVCITDLTIFLQDLLNPFSENPLREIELASEMSNINLTPYFESQPSS